jgi:hypothetical protein
MLEDKIGENMPFEMSQFYLPLSLGEDVLLSLWDGCRSQPRMNPPPGDCSKRAKAIRDMPGDGQSPYTNLFTLSVGANMNTCETSVAFEAGL